MTPVTRLEAFDNLVKITSLKAADRDEDEIHQYIAVATDLLRDAKRADISPHARYMLAYDGIHSLAMAVLLHYGTRPGDGPGHRTLALTKFADELQLDLGTRKIMLDAHGRRNESIYRSALPPVTHKDAETVISVLTLVLPLVADLVSRGEA